MTTNLWFVVKTEILSLPYSTSSLPLCSLRSLRLNHSDLIINDMTFET